MEYIRINDIEDPLFSQMYELMKQIFPAEEVLDFPLWKEPLEDPGIRVFVAVLEGAVVGATEYRYYPDFNVAMTDFTIIGKHGLGIGHYLMTRRQRDLFTLASEHKQTQMGMFAEIYDPYQVENLSFGGLQPMNPFVRREVLSHQGYRRLDFPYVHPSWDNEGTAVAGLDLCFLPYDEMMTQLPAELIVQFLNRYYAVLPNKPAEWTKMMDDLKSMTSVALLPI